MLGRTGIYPDEAGEKKVLSEISRGEENIVFVADDEARATATLLKALADPARLKIVSLLARSHEPVCACTFTLALGLTQATVSHHLKRLTDAGLLEREQRGKWAFFALDPAAIARLAELLRFSVDDE